MGELEGFFSSTGLPPCEPCAANTFATAPDTCTDCPLDQQTNGAGAANVSDCFPACMPGYFSASGFGPCEPCPRHFYQPDAGQTTCLECSAAQFTVGVGSTDLSDCMIGATGLLMLHRINIRFYISNSSC